MEGIEHAQPWRRTLRYSAAMRVGDLLFVSGQAAIGPDGQIVGEGDFQAQAVCVFENLRDVLAAAGSDLSRVAKVTIYLTDVDQFPTILEMRARYFTEPYPADTTVIVSGLARPGLMLEVEAIATVEA